MKSGEHAPALPGLAEIESACRRIAGHALRTPVIAYPALEDATGARLYLKCEHRQRIGAFKARGALNAVWSLDDSEARRGVLTHSSGNHGAALAYAAHTRGIAAHVVMPRGSPQSKRRNVEQAGGIVHECDPTQQAREAAAASLQSQTGGVFIHPYIDVRVIAGQGTVALELMDECGELDVLLTPVGGGGLAAGCAIAVQARQASMKLFAAEPEGAADTMASLRAGRRTSDIQPDTICDGLRATIGEINFQCLRAHGTEVLLVSDEECKAEMREIHTQLGEVIEPSSATVLAALRRYPERFAGLRIGVVLTGGNVDRETWPWLAQGEFAQ
ncbi:MAG: threonine/serine dehydratase [Rhodanobacteraceae bacterium]